MNKRTRDDFRADLPSAPESGGFGAFLLKQLRVSVVATVVLTVIVSGLYPAVVWGLAQALFHHQANGSLLKKDGTPTDKDEEAVGSALLGQPFSDASYFHPRPSAAGSGYDATASSGTNLGPLSAKLMNGTTKKDDKGAEVVDFDGVKDRVFHYCIDNNRKYDASQPLDGFKDASGNWDDVKLIKAFNDDKAPLTITPRDPIPPDAVTASASGLDPHISPANAEIQVPRVADARKIDTDKVKALLTQFTELPDLGVFGDPRVNVLELNLALDRLYPAPPAPATQPATEPATQPGASSPAATGPVKLP